MNIRLPGDLKPRLVEAAQANGRTINAEIVHRLERSFADMPMDELPEGAVQAILETRKLVGLLFDTTAEAHSPRPKKPKP